MFFGSIDSGGELSTSVYNMVKDYLTKRALCAPKKLRLPRIDEIRARWTR